MTWVLKKLSTNEVLTTESVLPENWENIMGLPSIKDKIGDLTWAGHTDLGWFQTAPDEVNVTIEPSALEVAEAKIRYELEHSDKYMLIDYPISKTEQLAWADYRKKLRELNHQPGYPNSITWPVQPPRR